eukprot:6194835-Pleurochrysis_carterae.AAC.3
MRRRARDELRQISRCRPRCSPDAAGLAQQVLDVSSVPDGEQQLLTTMSMLTVAAPLACGLLATHGGVVQSVLHAPVFDSRFVTPAMSVKSQEFYPTRESVIKVSHRPAYAGITLRQMHGEADIVEIFKNPSIYKEATREFRRDVYSYKDWLWHRESGHVADAFMSVFTSSVSKWLWSEIFFVIVSAVAVLTYNDG